MSFKDKYLIGITIAFIILLVFSIYNYYYNRYDDTQAVPQEIIDKALLDKEKKIKQIEEELKSLEIYRDNINNYNSELEKELDVSEKRIQELEKIIQTFNQRVKEGEKYAEKDDNLNNNIDKYIDLLGNK